MRILARNFPGMVCHGAPDLLVLVVLVSRCVGRHMLLDKSFTGQLCLHLLSLVLLNLLRMRSLLLWVLLGLVLLGRLLVHPLQL